MRRYFYLLLFLFSVALFSQDINNEIVGKWKVIDVDYYNPLYCGPRNNDDYLKPLINTKLEFTESGDFFYTNYGVDILKMYNSKWYINNEDVIEIQSLNYEKPLKIKLKESEENFYYISFSLLKLKVIRITD